MIHIYLPRHFANCLIMSALFLSTSPVAFTQDFSDPVEYNNFIIEQQSELIEKSLEYIALSVHSEDYIAIENKRLEFTGHVRESLTKIRKMPSFNGNSRLKNETIDAFRVYLETYETDLLEVLALKKKYKDSYEALEAYFRAEDQVEEKLMKAINKLGVAQENFAKKNELKITKTGHSSLDERVEFINELSNYSRSVFLEYFKVSKEFNDMVKILHERKGKLLDKKRIEVIETGNEALANLKRIKPFNNDREYRDQTVNIIEYFQSLCKKEFGRIARLYEKETLTQKEADYINKVFSDYNANIEVLIYNWNMANQYLWKENINP
ncbi:MAG: hypothetical protein OEX02_06155 [Cyclobacteriaceae bacterium]|nr:hypothetical protein [Cyclobacteriaceae bacterium]